jgi:hypothetical protein
MPTQEKRKWFDVPDSLVKRENGEGTYHNVEAGFSDHPVLNVEKSKLARRNVYDLSIVLHTRVKRAMGDLPAVKNSSAQTIRFDKGTALGKLDFETAKAAIVRCWAAWEDYHFHRKALVTETEKWALRQINEMPLPGKVLVDVGGKLVEYDTVDPEEAEADDDDDDRPAVTPPKLVASQKGAAKAAA